MMIKRELCKKAGLAPCKEGGGVEGNLGGSISFP